MVLNFVPRLFYIGLSVMVIATLFKIQHWPGGAMNMMAAILTEVVCDIAILVEIFTSEKATSSTKLAWGSGYFLLPLL